jgi:ADP-ribose pyrophosphatase YjhB (NUDIX family)
MLVDLSLPTLSSCYNVSLRLGKTWFPLGSISPDEEHVDAPVRELLEETGLILTPDNLSLLTNCIKSMFEAPRGVSAKAHGVARTSLLRELGIAPIEAMATTARTRAFLKAPTLNTCISDLVRQPSRVRPDNWTSGTV